VSRSAKQFLWIGGFLLCGALLSILFFFPPEQNAFYPRCFLFATTGLQCPGCGGLRAVHQLLHGNISDAFHLNALFVTALPLLASFACVCVLCRTTGRTPPNPIRHPASGFILLGILITFAILRNLT